MATFANTANPTPYSQFDSEASFQSDADAVATLFRNKVGDPVLSIEMTNKQIWACFEESALEYSSIINTYHAKSTLGTILGSPTGSLLSGSTNVGPHAQQNRYPQQTLEFLKRMAAPYGQEAGVGGNRTIFSGSINTTASVQDYNLDEMLSSSATGAYGSRWDGSQLVIREIMHYDPTAAFRFFDSTTAINYLNNEFNFESFTPETVFYVLPIYEDILRGMQLDLSQRVRRSNFSYEVINNKLRLFPEPTKDGKLWVRYQKRPDPFDEDVNTGQLEGVSNLSNVPYGVIKYGNLNSIARQWIREFCIALCTEALGRIRSKFQTIPIPGNELTLDGDALVTQGIEKQQSLKDKLHELLSDFTYDKVAERDALTAENINKQLRFVPFAVPILVG